MTPGRTALVALVLAAAALGSAPGGAPAQPNPATPPAPAPRTADPAQSGPARPAERAATRPVDEETVRQIAADLRCVVCQNLSVADSPSETANQMRAIIRERLARGDSPAEVRAYFVEKYGRWILLEPPREGFTLLVWVAPFAALLAGLVVVALVVRRWRRAAGDARSADVAPVVDDAMRARLRREMAELDAPTSGASPAAPHATERRP